MDVHRPIKISPSDLVTLSDGTTHLVVEVWDDFSTGVLVGVMIDDEIKIIDAHMIKRVLGKEYD